MMVKKPWFPVDFPNRTNPLIETTQPKLIFAMVTVGCGCFLGSEPAGASLHWAFGRSWFRKLPRLGRKTGAN